MPLYMGALSHLEQLYDISILCDPLNSGNKAKLCTLSDCCKKVLVTQYIESLILYDDVLGTVLTQIETSYTAK